MFYNVHVVHGCSFANSSPGVGKNTLEPVKIMCIDSENLTERTAFVMLFQVLGRYYEHQRPDRDSYIQVLLENIEPGIYTTCIYMKHIRVYDDII